MNEKAIAPPLLDLSGKRALVTGSSRSIGFAIAEGLARHGATVAAVFLAGVASSFVNGHTLYVDGGISISL